MTTTSNATLSVSALPTMTTTALTLFAAPMHHVPGVIDGTSMPAKGKTSKAKPAPTAKAKGNKAHTAKAQGKAAPTALVSPAYQPVSVDKTTGRETYANGYVYDPSKLANAIVNGLLAQGANLPALVDALVKALPDRYAANVKAAHAKVKAHLSWLGNHGATVAIDKVTGKTVCLDGKAAQVNYYAAK
jgi:hypothetical protein